MKLKAPWGMMLVFLLLCLIGIVSQCSFAGPANIECGPTPLEEPGCKAVCFCDDDGCSWGYVCE